MAIRLAGARRTVVPVVAIALTVAIPAVLILTATTQGVALDWDAVVYLSAADSFAASGQLIDFRGDELTTFAPGLSVLVGALMRGGLGWNEIGTGLGVVSVMVVGVCTYVVGRTLLRSSRLALLVVLVVSVSVSTVRVFSYLKTEAPFTAMVMGVAALCSYAVTAKRTPWWWIAAVGLLCSAATTVRYIGFVLIPVVVLAVILAHRTGRGFRGGGARALGIALLAGAVSSIGLVLVSARNLSLGSPPLGERAPSGLTLGQVLVDLLGVLGSYLVPATRASLPQQVAGAVVLLLVAIGMGVQVRDRSAVGLVISTLLGGYLTVLIYSEINTVIQPVNERLVAPAFPLIAVIVAGGLAGLRRPSARSAEARRDLPVKVSVIRTAGTIVCLTAASVLVVSSAVASVSFAASASQKGVGYNSVAARASPTRAGLQALPADQGLAAFNGPSAYLAVRRQPIDTIPWTNYFSRGPIQPRIEALKARVDSGDVDYLVYFSGDRGHDVVTPKNLRTAGWRLTRLAKYSDGEIWKVVR